MLSAAMTPGGEVIYSMADFISYPYTISIRIFDFWGNEIIKVLFSSWNKADFLNKERIIPDWILKSVLEKRIDGKSCDSCYSSG